MQNKATLIVCKSLGDLRRHDVLLDHFTGEVRNAPATDVVNSVCSYINHNNEKYLVTHNNGKLYISK